MNELDLEPLAPDIEQLLQLATPPPVPPGVAEAVLLKVKATVGVLPTVGTALHVASVSAASKVLVPLMALALGVGVGVGLDRALLRPEVPPVAVEAPHAAATVESPVTADPPPPVAPPADAKRPRLQVDTLGKERVMLDAARAALQQGRAEEALRMLDAHAAQYAAGQLAEERETLAVQALISSAALDAARARFSRFEQRYPKSPMREPLRQLLAR